MKIKPTHPSFQFCKWLNENGFNGISPDEDEFSEKMVYAYHHRNGKYEIVSIRTLNTSHNSQQYDYVSKPTYYAPEQCKVVEWLWSKYKLWIYVIRDGGWFIPNITDSSDEDNQGAVKVAIKGLVCFNTPEEAYNAAFDYVLNNNLI
jgi:hypothetical protein